MSDVKLSSKTPVSIKTKWDSFITNKKLASDWLKRNMQYAEVFMTSLETDYISFQQNIFVKQDIALIKKLQRIGFSPLKGFPDEEKFDFFSKIYYNRKYNIAISFYPEEYEHAVKTSYEIVKKAGVDDLTGCSVFLSTLKVLLEK